MAECKCFGYNNDYLSRENTNCIKGIFAFCVIAHHLSQSVHIYDFSIIASIFQFMGYLSVAVFFFFSGYGLVISYDKKPDYLRCFPKNRLLDFYIKYLLIAAVYLIYNIIFAVKMPYGLLLNTLFYGGTIVSNGWYFQTILIVYLLFFFIFKIFKNKNIQLLVYGISLFAFCEISAHLNISLLVIECVFSVLVGMIWARNKEKIDKILFGNKKTILYFVASFLLFAFTLILWNTENSNGFSVIFIKLLSAIFFVTTVLFVVNYINFKNKVTSLLGNYFLELYAFHGLFIRLFHSELYVKNDYIFIVLVIICSYVFAVIMHKLFNLVSKLLKKT